MSQCAALKLVVAVTAVKKRKIVKFSQNSDISFPQKEISHNDLKEGLVKDTTWMPKGLIFKSKEEVKLYRLQKGIAIQKGLQKLKSEDSDRVMKNYPDVSEIRPNSKCY